MPQRLDSVDKAFDASPGKMRGQRIDDLVPGRVRHFAVDAFVSDHLGVVLGEGDVDHHAGAALGGVQALRQELLDAF